MVGALILMSVHVAGKAIRDTLFLSNFEVSDLPKMMIAASAVSMLAAVTVSRVLSRWDPSRTVPMSMLVVITFIDLDHQIIPDLITLPGMAIGLAVSLLPGGLGIVEALVGLVVGGGSLYLIALLGDWLFKKESMGGGDIKMAAMLGAFLGWQKVLFVFMASALIGVIVSLAVMAFSARLRRERVIPFGPFIALAAMVAILWGDRLITFYTENYLHLN
jgi:leader peptidase (prepilin peptidase)/N-methyltransferase